MRWRAFVLALAVGALACTATNFDPGNEVKSVRILATRADKPYALPSDALNLDVLAFDGRPSKPQPMNVFWLPAPCFNPAGDAYYACYPAFAASFAPGDDLTPALMPGTSFSFTMPDDIITSHQGSRGGAAYGIAVVFTIACAGHVELIAVSPGESLNTLPFGCFDEGHARLGADHFMFAYSLVYAFADRTNANPTIDQVTFGGKGVDPTAGITVDHCNRANIDDCPTTPLDLMVPPSSQETDPGNIDANGRVLAEQIYVDYFVTGGKVKHDVKILFDPRVGPPSSTSNDLFAPQAPGDYLLWVVVHDNRGGATWAELALHAD
jgi:hypothetical protein